MPDEVMVMVEDGAVTIPLVIVMVEDAAVVVLLLVELLARFCTRAKVVPFFVI